MGLITRASRAALAPPPGRVFTNPGDTVVFGEWGPRHRMHTHSPLVNPREGDA